MDDILFIHSRSEYLFGAHRRIALRPLAVLPLLLILALTSCGTSPSAARTAGQGSHLPAQSIATPVPSVFPCPPVTDGATPRCSVCRPAQSQSPASLPCLPCPPGPAAEPPTCLPCLPDRETACFVASPEPTPRLGQPAIVFCPNPPVPVQSAPGILQLRGFVCGHGFRSAELVTLTASGPRGRLTWQLRADRVGSFVSPLPLSLCGFVPFMLIATGNEGSHSNTLFLGTSSCAPTT
jgi:hypothetical protein